eukprot:CAMPEP_0197913518 /NCGR_PEP_ID=MMETSP1439-20131203/76784_1 /TAXON_ID=66791 /ORGANISM="Gonyaulax spinifera, Strain CCMP409" /LENGTH=59 /DNA_ID=CAMNT_0043535379 /DNA_START=3 /DNA_END=179 /DNA_ORIENTATION=-
MTPALGPLAAKRVPTHPEAGQAKAASDDAGRATVGSESLKAEKGAKARNGKSHPSRALR